MYGSYVSFWDRFTFLAEYKGFTLSYSHKHSITLRTDIFFNLALKMLSATGRTTLPVHTFCPPLVKLLPGFWTRKPEDSFQIPFMKPLPCVIIALHVCR